MKTKAPVRSKKDLAGAFVCVKVVGVKKQSETQGQCTLVERNGQLVFTLNSEILLPEDAPVRLTNAQLEELDYRKLYVSLINVWCARRNASAKQTSEFRISEAI